MLYIAFENSIKSYDKQRIVIGGDPSCDLYIEGLLAQHVSIEASNNNLLIENLANDPFVSINGLPFRKKRADQKAVINIGRMKIAVDTTGAPLQPQESVSQNEELDFLLREVEDLLDPKPKEPDPTPTPDSPSPSEVAVDFDDESQGWDDPPESAPSKPKERHSLAQTGLVVFVAFSIILLCLVIASGVYFSISEKNRLEEVSAASHMADIAMALRNASFNNRMPEKQNWSDSHFLNHNLAEVLAPEFIPSLSIDSQGKIDDLPYFLRIYVGNDTSRFLAIAQPAPSIRQWLIPKAAIIVDSEGMTLQTVADLRELNRYLLNMQTFDETEGNALHALLAKANVIPLALLEHKRALGGYTPPKSLSVLKPGAEKVLYNAPRYYPFTDNVLKNQASENKKGKTLKDLASIPNLVLYTSEGIHRAVEAQRSASDFFLQDAPVIAYLKFSDDKKIKSSHLLSWSEPQESLLPPQSKELEAPLAMFKYAEEYIDSQLYQLKSDRQYALEEIAKGIEELLLFHQKEHFPDIAEKLRSLAEEYLRTNEEHALRIKQEVAILQQDFPTIEKSAFVEKIRSYGFDLSQEEAGEEEEMDTPLDSTDEEAGLSQIREATGLTSLAAIVNQISKAVPEPNLQTGASYQKAIRFEVLKKLDRFFFSKKDRLPPEAFSSENRQVLEEVLLNSWVADENEYKFYLSEFDYLSR